MPDPVEPVVDPAAPAEPVVDPAAPAEPVVDPAAPPVEPVVEPAEPTAEDLKKQLEESQAEVDRLKGEEPAEPAPAPKTDGAPVANAATQAFIRQTMPAARKMFMAEDVTSEKQFDVMVETSDKLVGAVMTDQVRPAQHNLAVALIEANNNIEMLQLQLSDADFKGMETTVRKSLDKMTLQDRAKPQAVTKVYHQLRGSKSGGKAATTPARTPAAVAALKDVSAGGGAPRKASSARLTAEQETERRTIQEEQTEPFTPEQYAAKLKVRQDRAKANKRPEPKLLLEV